MRPISYRPVLRYRVPQPTKYIPRETEGAAHERYELLAPAVLNISQHIAGLTERIGGLLQNTAVSHDTITDFYTEDPLSEKGRMARREIEAAAGGFRGDPNLRRALILEPMRIVAQDAMTGALQVWGCDDPEYYGRTGLPQDLYQQLAENELTLAERSWYEYSGRLQRIDQWAKRLHNLASLIQEIQNGELSLESLDTVSPGLVDQFRNQIRLIIGQRMRAVDQIYWESLRRVQMSLASVPRLAGPAAIRENLVYEWADKLVQAAEKWVEEIPEAEPHAAEIVYALGWLVKEQRRLWSTVTEADQAIATVLGHALDAMKPFLRLQALMASFQ